MDEGRLLALGTVPQLIGEHGGSSHVTAKIAKVPIGVSLPGTTDGQELRFVTREPIEELARLNSLHVQFDEIQISQPNLESVFLSLTGRSLRD